MKHRVYVISQTDLMKYMLNRPVLSEKIGKWLLSLIEFLLAYHPQKSVKGQALTNFLADHPRVGTIEEEDLPVYEVNVQPWVLKFNGSSTDKSAGVSVVITSPFGTKITLNFHIVLEIIQDLGAKEVLIVGDSQLVIK